MKLLEGFYSPDNGDILYFGKSASAFSPRNIRDLFAYIPQECLLFEVSIGENISSGRPDAKINEIHAAARLAGLKDFIEGLPQKYDTPVGENGGALSGGQRQRIAIARALVKNAPIFLLDEFTASLDSFTEKEILKTMDIASKGKTVITISHKLNTVQDVDRILVMENGEIVEEGNFHTLLSKHGKFWELYKNQQSPK